MISGFWTDRQGKAGVASDQSWHQPVPSTSKENLTSWPEAGKSDPLSVANYSSPRSPNAIAFPGAATLDRSQPPKAEGGHGGAFSSEE